MVFSTWRRGYTGVALVCCALLWGESIHAQEESAGSTDIGSYLDNPEDFGGRGNEYITLDVRDKDLSEILKFISRRVGINVIADPDVDEKVTVQLDAVDWRDAIHVLARQTHCEILDVSDRLVRFTQPPSISMEFQDADIKIVLELLAKQAGANIMMASDIQGKVSLSLREVP